jgi:hypothetical protein
MTTQQSSISKKVAANSVSVIFERTGDLQKTAIPRAFSNEENNAKFDFSALHRVQVSFDDYYQFMEIPKYFVKSISLPTWVSEQFFLQNYNSLKYAYSLAPKFVETLNEDTFTRFSKLDENDQYLIEYIFVKSAKNDFFASLISQVYQWLNEVRPQNRFPLSQAQAKAASKFCRLYEAKKITTALYWAGE